MVFQTRVFKNYKEDLRFYASRGESVAGGVYLKYFLYLQALTCKAPGSEIEIQFKGEEAGSYPPSNRAKLNTISIPCLYLQVYLGLAKLTLIFIKSTKVNHTPLAAKR